MADASPSGPPEPDTTGLASRRVAFRVLRRVHVDGAWSSLALATELHRSRLDARDRAFAANLAYSTLRWEGTLDWALGQVLARPLDQVESEVLDVLRLGAWQLLKGSTPARAAVTTAVALARAVVGDRATGFVNGVLRGLDRRRDDLPWPPPEHPDGIALRMGYPPWIVAEAVRRFGDRAPSVLEAGNKSPGVTLRASGPREALLAELLDAGVAARPTTGAADGIHAAGADPGRLAAVAEGRAAVQDEASMLVVAAVVAAIPAAAGVRRVLDACAGPGGKAAHLAGSGLAVVATDVHEHRARLVAETAQRLGVRVAVTVADATAPPLAPASFQAVLVDAPCSGLGTDRRRPELRWRRQPSDLERLAELQTRLLRSCASLVMPGGVLVYSACTWPDAETTQVAQAFLDAHPGFAAEPPALAGVGTALPSDPGVQLAPDLDGTDGMYVAVFRHSPPESMG